jgi:hypothetical protein
MRHPEQPENNGRKRWGTGKALTPESAPVVPKNCSPTNKIGHATGRTSRDSRTTTKFCPGPDPSRPNRTIWIAGLCCPAGDALTLSVSFPRKTVSFPILFVTRSSMQILLLLAPLMCRLHTLLQGCHPLCNLPLRLLMYDPCLSTCHESGDVEGPIGGVVPNMTTLAQPLERRCSNTLLCSCAPTLTIDGGTCSMAPSYAS